MRSGRLDLTLDVRAQGLPNLQRARCVVARDRALPERRRRARRRSSPSTSTSPAARSKVKAGVDLDGRQGLPHLRRARLRAARRRLRRRWASGKPVREACRCARWASTRGAGCATPAAEGEEDVGGRAHDPSSPPASTSRGCWPTSTGCWPRRAASGVTGRDRQRRCPPSLDAGHPAHDRALDPLGRGRHLDRARRTTRCGASRSTSASTSPRTRAPRAARRRPGACASTSPSPPSTSAQAIGAPAHARPVSELASGHARRCCGANRRYDAVRPGRGRRPGQGPGLRRPRRPVVSAAFRGPAPIPHVQPGLAVPAGPLHPDRDRLRARARGRGGDLLRLGAGRHPDRRAHGPRHRGARRALGARDRRPAQRHLRQRARAHHRPLRARRRAARGRQGLDRRLDHGQRPARARRGDVLRRAQARPPDFNRTAASAQSSMLLLAAAALVMPAIYELVDGQRAAAARRRARALRQHRPGALGRRGVRADLLLRRRACGSR